ncbi:MAG: hypothetical protein ACE5I3_01165 [Phycisphaerae bacterium]
MDHEFQRQEREIDRRIAALATYLRAPAPRPGFLAEVKAALSAEAQRLQRRQRRLVALRPLAGVAAALLLAVSLSLPRGSSLSEQEFALGQSPGAVFADWVDALEESGEQFTKLLEEDWLFEGFGSGGGENGDVGDPLDSLEESLESFERMTGA